LLLPSANKFGTFSATRNPKFNDLFQPIAFNNGSGLTREIKMISRRSILLLSGAFLAGGSSALAAPGHDPIKMFDLDADGTLDLAEVKKAAADLFAQLDPDHDGTLDKHELAGRLSARELAAADPDHDGTLTLDEYLAVVQKRFNAANRDADGTLDARELRTPAGRALLRLLK
jgi:hypothetical protein